MFKNKLFVKLLLITVIKVSAFFMVYTFYIKPYHHVLSPQEVASKFTEVQSKGEKW